MEVAQEPESEDMHDSRAISKRRVLMLCCSNAGIVGTCVLEYLSGLSSRVVLTAGAIVLTIGNSIILVVTRQRMLERSSAHGGANESAHQSKRRFNLWFGVPLLCLGTALVGHAFSSHPIDVGSALSGVSSFL